MCISHEVAVLGTGAIGVTRTNVRDALNFQPHYLPFWSNTQATIPEVEIVVRFHCKAKMVSKWIGHHFLRAIRLIWIT